MNNKDKKTQANQNAAADLMSALNGKTPEEQAALIAASLQAYQEHNEDRVDALLQSQEDMARKLESLGGEAAKKAVDDGATIDPKKSFGAGVVEVITSRPVVIGAGVAAAAAVATAGVYVYKKHHKGQEVAASADDILALEGNQSSSELSKDAAVAAALSDR